MTQVRPVLVFAQSARFIAESAARTGFTVRAIDCFADTDTLNCADSSIKLPPLNELNVDKLVEQIIQLSRKKACYLVCGSGIEKIYSLLHRLPDYIELLGPGADTIAQLKQPAIFFDLLAQLGVQTPLLSLSPPSASSGIWLRKSADGFGGSHIEIIDQSLPLASTDKHYYQQFINGTSASACFISNGKQAHILAVNQQQYDKNFQLNAISAPFEITARLQQQLHYDLARICQQTDLRGINSIDFIISDGELYILEINPRISASAELLQQPRLFQWHLDACLHQRLPEQPYKNKKHRLLAFIFATQDLQIPKHFPWPDGCHDIPAAGSQIGRGQPVCSFLITHRHAETCRHKLGDCSKFIMQKLSADS